MHSSEQATQVSYPPTPPPCSPVRQTYTDRPSQSVDAVRRITPPEEKTPIGEEQRDVIKAFNSSYDQALTYVGRFMNLNQEGSPSLLEPYEMPLSIKLSMSDWVKLSSELNIWETDQKSRISFQAISRCLLIYYS